MRTFAATSVSRPSFYDVRMGVQSLVLCRDPEVLRALCPLLFEMDIGVEICLGSNGATRMLRKRRFDAVIVECGNDGSGLEVLQELRAESPNQNTICVGVVDDPKAMQAAFATGANFVLSKPISVEDASRILRFTSGILGRMVRRFLRVAVHRMAHVNVAGMKDPAFILDLSEGGIAIHSIGRLVHGQDVEVSFILPGTTALVEARGTVAWIDDSGKSGVEFTRISDENRAILKRWVTEKLRKSPHDVPGASVPSRSQVSVLSQYIRPLARLIDGAFVVIATAVFFAVALLFTGAKPNVTLSMGTTFAISFIVGSAIYAGLFTLLDVRFPGTRAVQGLLQAANAR
jgi:CheY-like chemotaxis protein